MAFSFQISEGKVHSLLANMAQILTSGDASGGLACFHEATTQACPFRNLPQPP